MTDGSVCMVTEVRVAISLKSLINIRKLMSHFDGMGLLVSHNTAGKHCCSIPTGNLSLGNHLNCFPL